MNSSDHKGNTKQMNFYLEFQKLAQDRSNLETRLLNCDPKWISLYRSFIAKMNQQSLKNGLAEYPNHFHDFEDISKKMSHLHNELARIQQAANVVQQQLKIANDNNNEEDASAAKELDVVIRQQFTYSYDSILRQERDLIGMSWKGNRPL